MKDLHSLEYMKGLQVDNKVWQVIVLKSLKDNAHGETEKEADLQLKKKQGPCHFYCWINNLKNIKKMRKDLKANLENKIFKKTEIGLEK
jgi:hypothetical protein